MGAEEALVLGLGGPVPARLGRGLRRPQGPSLLGLRAVRLRRAGRHGRRLLRPLPRPAWRRSARACASSSRRWPKLPSGPVIVDDKKVALPPKSEVYSNIEALMNHFKLVYEGILAAAGRGLRLHRGRQRRAGLLHRQRRAQVPVAASKVRPPCFSDLPGLSRDDQGRPARRRGRDHRRPERHRRGAGQVTHAQVHASTARRSRFRAGTTVIQAGAHGRDPRSPLLLAPRPARGRQLPHVPGRDREDAEAADRLQHAASPTAWWCARRARRPCRRTAPTLEFLLVNHPIDCPVLRPGRRVLPAGPVHGPRPPRLARSSSRRRSSKRKVVDLGPDHARRRALRAVLALHPLRGAPSPAPTASSS